MNWRTLCKRLILANERIDEYETELLRRAMYDDGIIDEDEVRFLLELKREATSVHPEFMLFLQHIMKKAIIREGTVALREVVWMEKLIGQERIVSVEEVRFLHVIRREANSVCPEFHDLLNDCRDRYGLDPNESFSV